MAKIHFKLAALLATVMVVPLLFLELVYATKGDTWVPDSAALFSFLWVLAFAFVSTLFFVINSTRTRMSFGPLGLIAGVLVLLVVGVALASAVADQMPCFIGVPNCD